MRKFSPTDVVRVQTLGSCSEDVAVEYLLAEEGDVSQALISLRGDKAVQSLRHTEAVRETARVAIGHLQKVLNGCRTSHEQASADAEAREWLRSIGGGE